jgi:hypothetical protein
MEASEVKLGYILTFVVPLWASCSMALPDSSAVFYSSKGFSVRYPKSWRQIRGRGAELDILSTGTRNEGAVIPRGAAEIIVREIPPVTPSQFTDFLKQNYHVTIISDRAIQPTSTHVGACAKMRFVNAGFEVAPGAVQLDTFALCTIQRRAFVVMLSRWASDADGAEWKRVTMDVISTIRLDREN